ncbi:MAG: MotA/TolQ/ExbB proton channel family protein [Candidatus Eiseniibacteriota bacterium]|jgi:biopolymer transport protein ExbB
MLVDFSWLRAIGSSPIFLVLVVCSVVTLAVTIERALYFWKRRGDPDRVLRQAAGKLRAGSVDDALRVCDSSPHPVGMVAGQVLGGGSLELAAAEERMQVALSQQKLLLERGVGVLGTMAAVAPLIGLLGTVWGIMRAFHDMALSGSAAPSVVAAGVAEALVTTAAGLVVAVPAVLLYNYFSRRINVMLTVAENHTRALREALVEIQAGRGRGPRHGHPAHAAQGGNVVSGMIGDASDDELADDIRDPGSRAA